MSSRRADLMLVSVLLAVLSTGGWFMTAEALKQTGYRDDLRQIEARFRPIREHVKGRTEIGFTSDRIRGGGHKWMYALHYTVTPVVVHPEPIVGPNLEKLLTRLGQGYALVWDFDDIDLLKQLTLRASDFLGEHSVSHEFHWYEPGLCLLLTGR